MNKILKVSTAIATLVLLNTACNNDNRDRTMDSGAKPGNTSMQNYPTDVDANSTARTTSVDQRTTGGSTNMNTDTTTSGTTTGTTMQKTNRTPSSDPLHRTGPGTSTGPADGTDKVER